MCRALNPRCRAVFRRRRGVPEVRHTYVTMLAKSAPVKVTQELSRHSTSTLTIDRDSHTDMKEKAEAVGRLPLPGAAVAADPLSGMSRADLEAAVVALYVALRLFTTPGCTRDTPRDTPTSGTGGDARGRPETGTNEGDRA